eukprot:scaffold19935_cov108-Isochrysis_galbana.AAC.6
MRSAPRVLMITFFELKEQMAKAAPAPRSARRVAFTRLMRSVPPKARTSISMLSEPEISTEASVASKSKTTSAGGVKLEALASGALLVPAAVSPAVPISMSYIKLGVAVHRLGGAVRRPGDGTDVVLTTVQDTPVPRECGTTSQK